MLWNLFTTTDRRNGRVIAAFLDIDLVDSLKPCVRAIWATSQTACRAYVLDAQSSPFFDSAWRANVGTAAPVFVRSGVGLPLGAKTTWGSDLGYAQKSFETLVMNWQRSLMSEQQVG